MARPTEPGDQPELGPNQPYPPPGGPQFPPAQYPYHPTSQYPNLDQDLNMADTYGQQNIASQLQEAAANAPRNGGMNVMNVDTNGSAPAGMAPPDTPHQGTFSPAGGRASVDETADAAEHGDSKRKRSKVSRACDQCRRKKVKCDAADQDGALTTCTNCNKSGLMCEYSRVPMKRGPSKGYIKELSERVKEVESLQAIIAGNQGYRQSLDGGSMAESLYSPDDPMSLKRNFSFWGDARNPFAASEFQRDRIPSVGGTWVNSPTSAGIRLRDRGSLALAPDQALPSTSYPKSSTPYWRTAEATESRPAKRQKLDPKPSNLKLESKHVDRYYEVVHPELPLLPDLDTTLNITQSATYPFQTFFAVSIKLIPATDKHDDEPPDAVDQAVLDLFSKWNSVWDFFSASILESPSKRSAEDNLIFVWACVLLAVHAEYNMRGVAGGTTSRVGFLKQAMDLTTFLQENDGDGDDTGKGPLSTGTETFSQLVDTARNLTLTLAKFNALASASMEWVLPEYFNITHDGIQALPQNAGFLASLANVVSQAILEVQTLLAPQNPLNIQMKQVILSQVQLCTSLVPGMSRDLPICRQAALFFALVLSRYHYFPVPASVLAPAAQLAEELSQAADPAGSGPTSYKPLDVHMFTLTTITLLEVLSAVPDATILAIAEQALNTIQPVIERKVELYHNYKSSLEKDEKWFEDDEEEGAGDGQSWMEILLKHIQDRRKVGWISATSANGGPALAGNVTVAFDQLLRTGYLKVLANLA